MNIPTKWPELYKYRTRDQEFFFCSFIFQLLRHSIRGRGLVRRLCVPFAINATLLISRQSFDCIDLLMRPIEPSRRPIFSLFLAPANIEKCQIEEEKNHIPNDWHIATHTHFNNDILKLALFGNVAR